MFILYIVVVSVGTVEALVCVDNLIVMLTRRDHCKFENVSKEKKKINNSFENYFSL